MNEDENAISMLEAKGYTVLYPIPKEASRIRMEKRMVRVLKQSIIPVLEHSGYTVTKTGVPKR
jgi:hypothetical protein